MALEWNVTKGNSVQPDNCTPKRIEPAVGIRHPIADLKKGDELIAVYWGLGDETDEDIIQHAKHYYNNEELKLIITITEKVYTIKERL